MIPKQPPTPEHTAQIILDAVKAHEHQLGIGSLALILKGSKDKRITNRQLTTSQFFGAFFYHPPDVIQNFIKELLTMGFLTTTNISMSSYPIPVLTLTDAGKYALEHKINIDLRAQRTVKPIALNDSARETLDLFQQTKSVRAVAQQRTLAESTIWTHLITCIKLGLISAADIIDQNRIKLILDARTRTNAKGLKEIKEALPRDLSYGEIQCVLADRKNPLKE